MKSIDVRAAAHAAHQSGNSGRSVALPLEPGQGPGDWTLGPGGDREPGNACVGIAIGCVLSLPIWLAVATVYLLLD